MQTCDNAGMQYQKLIKGSINLGFDLSLVLIGNFGPPCCPLGAARWGDIAGGDQVPLALLGWYFCHLVLDKAFSIVLLCFCGVVCGVLL